MLPAGAYEGRVIGRLQFLNRFWTGKTFTGSRVTNRIFGRDVITGTVSREGDRVVIRYRWGLTDYLTRMPGDQDQWAGVMPLGLWQVQFTLTRASRATETEAGAGSRPLTRPRTTNTSNA